MCKMDTPTNKKYNNVYKDHREQLPHKNAGMYHETIRNGSLVKFLIAKRRPKLEWGVEWRCDKVSMWECDIDVIRETLSL